MVSELEKVSLHVTKNFHWHESVGQNVEEFQMKVDIIDKFQFFWISALKIFYIPEHGSFVALFL